MEIFRHDFDNAKEASIFVLSDIHEGNASHNEDAFKLAVSQIEVVSKNKSVCVVLLGDLIDCIEVSDKRFNPAEISEKYRLKDLKDLPKKQADRVLENLKPIKHLIKFAVIGNHEESYIREHHFDVYEYYCHELECQKLGFFGIIRFSITSPIKNISKPHHNRGIFDIGFTHGRGGSGGKTLGYPLNWVKDIFEKFDIDGGIAGHRHKLIVHPALRLKINKELVMKTKKKWYSVAGGFLESYRVGHAGYFEGAMGETSDIGFVEFKLERYKGNEWVIDLVAHRMNV